MAQPWPSAPVEGFLVGTMRWEAIQEDFASSRRASRAIPVPLGRRSLVANWKSNGERWWKMVIEWWWNVGFYGISWENGMNGDLIGISWSKMIFSQLAVTSSPWKYPACFSHDLAVFWIEINFAYGILWQMSGPVFEKKTSCDMWKNVEHTK